MSAVLDPRDRDKLAKICGMFGSSFAGERLVAAERADEFVRTRGLGWHTVLGADAQAQSAAADDHVALVDEILAAHIELSEWDEAFLYSIRGFRKLSAKQRRVLGRLARKAGR